MNIQNRLKKLEESVMTNESDEFCQCFHKQQMAILNQVYGKQYNTEDILPDDTVFTDFCERCNKPVSSFTQECLRDLLFVYGDAGSEEKKLTN